MTRRHKKMSSKRVIRGDGFIAWMYKGQQHRGFNKPALLYLNGGAYYLVNGKLHRTDGPAVTAYGQNVWYIKGHKFDSEFEARAYLAGQNAKRR